MRNGDGMENDDGWTVTGGVIVMDRMRGMQMGVVVVAAEMTGCR